MSTADIPVVDVHAHALLPPVDALAGGEPGAAAARALDRRRSGAESAEITRRMATARLPALTDPDTRLASMDAAGVDVQVVSPSPSHYHYWAAPGLAREVARLAAEGIAALVAREPGRLLGLGLVPLQHPGDCAAALEHAVTGCGLAGVQISSHARADGAERTVELSDERLEPFWARAAELGAVIFLHPFGCSLNERLDRFYLSNIVGQPAENAVALSHLIFSGVLDRHPGLRVIAAHGGGYLPGYLGRSDHGWQVRPEARRCAQQPSSYLRRIWFDSLVHSPAALRALVAAAGPEQVVLGSDYPFDMGVTDPLARLLAAGLGEADSRAIAGGNAARLGLRPAAAPR